MNTSVVIASYNGSRFIEKQLDSIIKQTVLPTEIIISDDGSTDETIEIIRSFFLRNKNLSVHFKLVENKGLHGVVSNFQNAVLHATGDYIFFCDQDDIWFPNKVERLIEVMDSCSENVVIHNAQVLKKNIRGYFEPINRFLMGPFSFDSEGKCRINSSTLLWQTFYCCIIQGMCISIKRDYLLSILPFSKGSYHDIWILFCAVADDTLLAIADILAYYRIHENNECGLPEYKRKRSLICKLNSFDKKGKESILKQYVWYSDTTAYLNNKPITNNTVRTLYSFFTADRISALSKCKIQGLYKLFKAYKEGAYHIDGNVVFIHDVVYMLLHKRRTRLALLAELDNNVRSVLVEKKQTVM